MTYFNQCWFSAPASLRISPLSKCLKHKYKVSKIADFFWKSRAMMSSPPTRFQPRWKLHGFKPPESEAIVSTCYRKMTIHPAIKVERRVSLKKEKIAQFPGEQLQIFSVKLTKLLMLWSVILSNQIFRCSVLPVEYTWRNQWHKAIENFT